MLFRLAHRPKSSLPQDSIRGCGTPSTFQYDRHCGLILYMDQAIYLPGLLPLIALQVWRARAEARVLEERFGEEYLRYRAQTWL